MSFSSYELLAALLALLQEDEARVSWKFSILMVALLVYTAFCATHLQYTGAWQIDGS